VARDARWGRIEETYGEDPFLTTQIGLAYVRGIQGDDLREGVAATAKHFAAHGLPEGGMNWAPVHIGARELREVFLTPFRAVIEAGIASVMNAYHEMDGVPCGASRALLVDLLRGELGFTGVLSSDYFTLRTLVDYHKVARDPADAARLGLEAGVDIELPERDCYGEPLRQALLDGRIDMALVDAAVERVLTLKLRLGLFENPYVDEDRAVEVFNTPEQIALTRRIAQRSLVLLKNDGILPLSPALKRIAVIGASADSARLMQGDYHYPAHLDHMNSVILSPDVPSPQQAARASINWDEHLPQSTTVLAGIRAAVSADTEVRYAFGCGVDDDRSGFGDAIAAAAGADVAVVVVGDLSGLGAGCTVGESLDSATLILPGAQQALVEAIHATGTPVVLVLMTGRPYNLSWAAEHLPALIQAWLPAQEGGAAVADVLFGAVNPSGRLPVSFPRSVGQIPVFYNHKPSGGRSNWQGQYIDSPTTPLYAFGHGLSYTEFAYSDLQLSSARIAPTDTLTVSVKVQNTGQHAGEEVVQLYIADPISSVTRPVKQLKGFARVALQPNESRIVHFELDARHLAFYDAEMRYVVEPGVINVLVGAASNDIRQQAAVEVVSAVTPVEPVFTTPTRIE
jgi:beta-glucosidase